MIFSCSEKGGELKLTLYHLFGIFFQSSIVLSHAFGLTGIATEESNTFSKSAQTCMYMTRMCRLIYKKMKTRIGRRVTLERMSAVESNQVCSVHKCTRYKCRRKGTRHREDSNIYRPFTKITMVLHAMVSICSVSLQMEVSIGT